MSATRAATGRLRVAIISTPFVPVPPTQYGGTELVVAELIDGLAEREVDVTLFATGDSRGGFRRNCRVRALYESPAWPPTIMKELEHSAFALRELLRDAGGFDVVHAHTPTFLPLARMIDTPVVYTIHHALEAELCQLYRSHPEVTFVSISARQLELCGPFQRSAVIHHGVDPNRYRLGKPDPESVAFLGRLSEVKAPHVAVDAARRAGFRIRVGGRPHEDDHAYYRAHVAARLEQPHVDYLGELDHERKVALLSTARATLFPIVWEEPFGLVAIESMLCGCPVIAFSRGAVPELVDEGITGFIARDEDHMVELLSGPARPELFDRRACREHAARRFGAARMVEQYHRVYEAAARETTWRSTETVAPSQAHA